MNLQHEIDFFDKFEEKHGDYNVLGRYAYKRILDTFARLTGPRPGWNVVDLGCGSGAFTRRLRARFKFNITGMDISPGLIARAAQESSDETYLVGDLADTRLPDNACDCILYTGVLHHITDPQSRVKALREGLRILKPGGCMFAYDPSWHAPPMWLYRDPASPISTERGRTPNEILLRKPQTRQDLADAGFTDVSVTGLAGITFRHIDCPGGAIVIHLYNLYEGLLRISPLQDRWGTFLISFGRKPG